MRILQLLHGLSYGGSEKLVFEICKEFSAKDDMFVCAIDREGPLKDALEKIQVPVYAFKRKPGFDYKLVIKLAKIYEELDIDIIHAHHYTPFFYGLLAKLISKKKPRLIFTEHGRHQPDHINIKRIIFNKLMLSQIDAITAVSNFTKESLVKYEKFPPDRVFVIYNGVKKKETDHHALQMLRQELGFIEGGRNIICVGRFAAVKGQEILTRAMAYIAKEAIACRLFFVGTGELLEHNIQLAKELHLENKIVFVGPRTDVQNIISLADLLVVPSLSEACSLTILDAMAAGKPVIATDVDGNPELVEHGKTGLLIEPNNPRRMAEAVIKLFKDADAMKQMGMIAFEKYEKCFRFNKMIKSYEHKYQKQLYFKHNLISRKIMKILQRHHYLYDVIQVCQQDYPNAGLDIDRIVLRKHSDILFIRVSEQNKPKQKLVAKSFIKDESEFLTEDNIRCFYEKPCFRKGVFYTPELIKIYSPIQTILVRYLEMRSFKSHVINLLWQSKYCQISEEFREIGKGLSLFHDKTIATTYRPSEEEEKFFLRLARLGNNGLSLSKIKIIETRFRMLYEKVLNAQVPFAAINGDFKIENINIADNKIILCDVGMHENAPIFDDLAIFLNSLEMLAMNPVMRLKRTQINALGKCFIDGYFENQSDLYSRDQLRFKLFLARFFMLYYMSFTSNRFIFNKLVTPMLFSLINKKHDEDIWVY